MIIVLLFTLSLLASLLLFSGKFTTKSRSLALISSIIIFIANLALCYEFINSNDKQLSLQLNTLSFIGFDILLKVDALSIILLFLTTLITPIIIASTNVSQKLSHNFYALILLMQMALIGVFTANNMILFYVFWEIALLPVFLMTAKWGGENKRKITVKFFIYTLVGSLTMLLAILYLYTLTPAPHSFDFDSFYLLNLPYEVQVPVFLGFFLAFAIKIPLFPFHSWQAETYNVAPVQGTMLMAGIMLKMGLYGLIRFILPITPEVVSSGSLIFLPLILVGVIYGAIIAIRQPNLKKLIAFSSLSHVGLISLGLLSNNHYGIEGGILQMFSHGVNVIGFLLCYLIIYNRTKTDTIIELGGIAKNAPRFAVIFLIILLANIALPLTNSSVGEFLILLGLFKFNKIIAVLAGLTIIFGAVYMFRMYQNIMYGKKTVATENFEDLTIKETLLFVPIIISIFWIGIYPSNILQLLEGIIK